MPDFPNTRDIAGTLSSKQHRSGSVALTVLELSKAVTFATAMPSASYTVLFERAAAVASALGVTDKTASGFTLNLSVGLVETIRYVVIQD